MKQTAVRLPDETYARLQEMASKTGRTATFYIREAIDAYLDDLEDIYLAERALDEIKQGKSRTLSLEELKRELDLDA